MLAISNHGCRIARCSSDQMLANHQQPVLIAAGESLDNYASPLFQGLGVGLADLWFLGQIHKNATPMVGVDGLDDHWGRDLFRRFPGIFGTVNFASFGNRYPRGFKHGLGQLLVLSNGLGDGTGEVRLRSPDAALLHPLTHLNQTSRVESA